MAIKIVGIGKTKFSAQCKRCETKFTYELSDIKTNYVNGCEEVNCPECSESYAHPDLRSWED